MIQQFDLGDVVQMKKPHACGANEWTIIRVGADVKIKCDSCGRIVMLDRLDFVRMGKKILKKKESIPEEPVRGDAPTSKDVPPSKNERMEQHR